MPALEGVQQPPITPIVGDAMNAPADTPRLRTPFGTPTPLTPGEEAWFGSVFSIDSPYLATPMGWGEWDALSPGEENEVDVVVELAPATENER